MSDSKLTALVADVKKLNARVGALEKLLERIFRQKPVSEKQATSCLGARRVSAHCARLGRLRAALLNQCLNGPLKKMSEDVSGA